MEMKPLCPPLGMPRARRPQWRALLPRTRPEGTERLDPQGNEQKADTHRHNKASEGGRQEHVVRIRRIQSVHEKTKGACELEGKYGGRLDGDRHIRRGKHARLPARRVAIDHVAQAVIVPRRDCRVYDLYGEQHRFLTLNAGYPGWFSAVNGSFATNCPRLVCFFPQRRLLFVYQDLK